MSTADDLAPLDRRLGEMLESLSPQQMRKVATKVGRTIRARQAARIREQQDPDGQKFEPRKRRESKTKRKNYKLEPMFRKLRLSRFLRFKTDADTVEIGFLENVSGRIAAVHHYGLRDRVTIRGKQQEMQYPSRRLLGYSDADREIVMDAMIDALSS